MRPGTAAAAQMEFWAAAEVAPRVCGLLVGGAHAGLHEPFLLESEPGAWLVLEWGLSPKIADSGWWFPLYWNGRGSRRWTATRGGPPPDEAALFPSAAAAAEALAHDEPLTHRGGTAT